MSGAGTNGAAVPRRTLLIVTYHFPPSAASGSHRLLGFVRHLGRHGWDSVVIAPASTPYEPVDPALGRRVPAGTVVHEAPFYWTPGLRAARALWPRTMLRFDLARWVRRVDRIARRVVREHPVEAVLTSGPPHEAHALGRWLKRRHGLPWIADFRDPWVTAAWANFRPGSAHRGEVRLERQVMAEADVVIANAPTARDALHEAFPHAAGRIVALTNGYDPEAFEGLARRPDPEGRWTLTHPGQLYLGRDPRPLFDALRDVLADAPADRPRPRVRMLGGQEFHTVDGDLDHEARLRGLGEVVAFEPQVPYRDSLQAMVDADVLLLLDAPGRKTGVPAKLYEYLGAGRPILALGEPDGDTAWVLRTSGVTHRIVRPGDVAGIARALRELMAPGPDVGPAPGRWEFTREGLTGRLVAMLDRLAPPRPALRERAGDQHAHASP